jgi:signal transduction histidine kinase
VNKASETKPFITQGGKDIIAILDRCFATYLAFLSLCIAVGVVRGEIRPAGLVIMLGTAGLNLLLSQIARRVRNAVTIELTRAVVINPVIVFAMYYFVDGPMAPFWIGYVMVTSGTSLLLATTARTLAFSPYLIAYYMCGMSLAAWLSPRPVNWYAFATFGGLALMLGIFMLQTVTVLTRSLTKEFERSEELESALKKISEMQQELVRASRRAGMAEVAIGVLHNVGNILNSVTTSEALVRERIQKINIAGLKDTANLIREPEPGAIDPLVASGKRKQLSHYVDKLSDHFSEDLSFLEKECRIVSENIDHIRVIISAQQANARTGVFEETFRVDDLVQDALKVSAVGAPSSGFEVIRDFAPIPEVRSDRHRVLQVLVNLLANARHALKASNIPIKQIKVRTHLDGDRLTITVEDNGVGIPAENLAKIFTYGFSTKKDGHGFGLHASALAAKDMQGSLTCHSDGPGKGATFVLDIPFKPAGER